MCQTTFLGLQKTIVKICFCKKLQYPVIIWDFDFAFFTFGTSIIALHPNTCRMYNLFVDHILSGVLSKRDDDER